MKHLALIFAFAGLLAAEARADVSFDPMMFSGEKEAEAAAFQIKPPSKDDVKGDALQQIKARRRQTQPLQTPVPSAQPQPKLMDESDLDFPDDDVEIQEDGAIAPRIQLPQDKPAALSKIKTPAPQSELQTLPDTSQGLVDAIADKDAAQKIDLTPSLPTAVEKTWIGKITEKAAEELSTSAEKKNNSDAGLKELMQTSATTQNKRSNASVFDISGVMLRMSKEQVERIMQNRGFQKVHEKFEIPNFIRWRNEEKCRNSGVVGYERLANCVAETAKKDGHRYTDTLKFSKFDTKEHISVHFTSNFTRNKVYKITYKSMSQTITGNSPKAIYLRNIKIYDFWKKVNQKYGTPDNKDEVIWGMGGTKPYLQASSGYLLLEDPMLRELDFTRMSREDQRYMNTDLYNF